MSEGVFETLVALLKSSASSTGVLSNAVSILANLVHPSPVVCCKEIAARIAAAGAIKTLVELLSSPIAIV